MTTFCKQAFALLCLILACGAQAQVPGLLSYQGRVAVGSVNFNGSGQFKFALVNTNGSTTYWSNDGTSTAGGQPAAAVNLTVTKGLYSVLLGDTTLTNMTAVPASVFGNTDVRLRVWFNDGVNGFQMLTPDQRIAAVGYAMTAGSVPAGSITSSMLASGAVQGSNIAAGAVGGAQLAADAAAANLNASGLSGVPSGGIVASNDPASAALTAQGFVRDPGTTTLGESWTAMPTGDSVAGHTAVWTGTELLIWGGVVPGPSVAGMFPSQTAINRGLRYNPTTGKWTPISTVGAPQARYYHHAVWTGTQMIVWGGQTTGSGSGMNMTFPTMLATGGIYTPATDTWTSMAPNGTAPIIDARSRALAFWTGTDLLIWGGTNILMPFGSNAAGMPVAQGTRYNLATNTWSNMAANLPEMTPGMNWSGVWTGTALIVWSNQTVGDSTLPAAGMYTPGTDSWQTLPRIPGNPAVATAGFSTIWTGTELVLWGGYNGTDTYTNAGYRFNPTTTSWTTTSTSGAPAARTGHYAVNLGGKMFVWGGQSVSPGAPSPVTNLYRDGGVYDPVTNTWQSIAATDAPPNRTEATVTTAGDRAIVWAGIQNTGTNLKFLKNGASYQPASDTWAVLANGSPAPRFGHSAIWTGTELIVWGGTAGNGAGAGSSIDFTFNDGARYNPATGVWTALPTTNAPSGRYFHSAVWTGSEMIVWGGQYTDSTTGFPTAVTLNSGARYNPQTNTWTATSTASAPSVRSMHSAVWTGAPTNRMIVWGGSSTGVGFGQITDGALYAPATDSWSSISTTRAPDMTVGPSAGPPAMWTGTEMVVFAPGYSSGGRYNPVTNTWQPAASAPIQLINGSMVSSPAAWTDTSVAVFLPGSSNTLYLYSPVADFWQQSAATGVPTGNFQSAFSVWTGSNLVVWGAIQSPTTSYAGGLYTTGTDSWSSLTSTGAPAAVFGTNLRAGSEVLMWGGTPDMFIPGGGTVSDTGIRYRPAQSYYLYRRP